MASSYRSIKPAPARDGTFRKAPQDRVAPKRTGMIKSACWECRKRKAKCNGLKPVCANCAKLETVCIYDADVRESRVRNLQSANERLEAELGAAKILLRQVASGPEHMRSLVLGFLENDKEPLEILHVLRNTEGVDFVIPKTERGGNAGGSGLPIVPVVPAQEYGTSITPMQPVAPLPDTEYYSMSDSITADSAFGHPSMLYAPLYNSSSSGSGEVPRYTASSVEGFNQVPLQNSQVLESPVPTVGPSSSGPYTATLPIHDQRAIVRQPENRSLFFEPLFNHTDFYLTTAVGTSGRSPNNTHQGTVPFDSQPAIPHEESFESASSFDGSTKPVNESSLRIHPNVRNHFNNLSLSRSIRVNGYPRNIQDAQIRNIFVPNWAATSLNTVPDPGGLDDAFGDIYQQAKALLKDGEPLTKIFGHHPNVAALYDQQEFDRSCLLSQWAARMVHSVKRKGYDFTCFASMNVFWYVMRWMIQPSPETYAAMPEWIRPTSNQLFTPHISMADFVLWPGFRELVVQLPQLQERMAWLADMSMFINCEWPYPLEQALHRNPVSGDVDLVDLAKQHVWTLQCWSVGPSFRRFVNNADSYLLIRPDEEPGNV